MLLRSSEICLNSVPFDKSRPTIVFARRPRYDNAVVTQDYRGTIIAYGGFCHGTIDFIEIDRDNDMDAIGFTGHGIGKAQEPALRPALDTACSS